MLVSFLQEQAKVNEKCVMPEFPNLGHLLLDFLRYYGRDFDYHNRAITVQSLDRLEYAPSPTFVRILI